MLHHTPTHQLESGGEDGVVVSAGVVEEGDDEGGGHEGVDGVGELRLAVGEQLGGQAARHGRRALDREAQQHGDLFQFTEQHIKHISIEQYNPSDFGHATNDVYLQIGRALVEGEGMRTSDVGLRKLQGPENLNISARDG